MYHVPLLKAKKRFCVVTEVDLNAFNRNKVKKHDTRSNDTTRLTLDNVPNTREEMHCFARLKACRYRRLGLVFSLHYCCAEFCWNVDLVPTESGGISRTPVRGHSDGLIIRLSLRCASLRWLVLLLLHVHQGHACMCHHHPTTTRRATWVDMILRVDERVVST